MRDQSAAFASASSTAQALMHGIVRRIELKSVRRAVRRKGVRVE
jgi:hypothetical protein